VFTVHTTARRQPQGKRGGRCVRKVIGEGTVMRWV
jgi:hypothetical protein